MFPNMNGKKWQRQIAKRARERPVPAFNRQPEDFRAAAHGGPSISEDDHPPPAPSSRNEFPHAVADPETRCKDTQKYEQRCEHDLTGAVCAMHTKRPCCQFCFAAGSGNGPVAGTPDGLGH